MPSDSTLGEQDARAREQRADEVRRLYFTANGSPVCPECREAGTVELGYENADCTWCGADVWATFEPVL